MISYEEALNLVLKTVTPLPARKINASEALSKISTEPAVSLESLPPFDNSAMDGFAVVTSEMKDASPDHPITLKIMGSTAAGDQPSDDIVASGAWEIMTGAPVPSGYDAVICVEDSVKNADATSVTLSEKAFTGKNIRRAGADIKIGDQIFEAGTKITPAILMGLAATGIADVSIADDIKIAILSTGKELVDDANSPLKAGQIRNSNGPFLKAELTALGTSPYHGGTIFDDVDDFNQTLKSIMEDAPQIILSTGAVSMGKYDFIPDSLRELGAEIIFHKCAMRPGKPILFARLPNGSFYFGLPGNPIATAAGLNFFVAPLIRALRGEKDVRPQQAVLDNDYHKKSSFRFFLKARRYIDENAVQRVEIFDGQESFKIMPFAKANCWAIIKENDMDLPAGHIIDIIPFT